MEIVALCDYKPVIIYGIEFSGVVMYVGATSKGVKSRITAHFRHAVSDKGRLRNVCPKLYAFIRENQDLEKYRILVLEHCSAGDAEEREKHYVAFYDTKENGLNSNTGGNWARGDQHYMYGKHVARHVVAASVAARTGKKLTPEHVEKIRKGNAKADRVDCRPVVRDDGTEYYGVTEAARQNGVTHAAVSIALTKGYKAAGHNFRYADGEFIIREEKTRAMPIRCLETGAVYASAKEAAEALGLSRGNLSQHLQGINKTCKGHTFEFLMGSQ